jgi:hypothetical protein
MNKTNSFISRREKCGESIPRVLGYTLWALFLLLLGLTPCMGQNDAQKLEAKLKEHGRVIVAKAPEDVRNGSPLEKAKYVFNEYCKYLNQQGCGFNRNLLNQAEYNSMGNIYMCQCGWHNDRLKELMVSMGIKPEDMSGVVADANSSLPVFISPNQEHGALAVRDKDGKVYIFDVWELANDNVIVSTGLNDYPYADPEISKWNGLEADLWQTEMLNRNYVRFNDPQMLEANYTKDLKRVIDRIWPGPDAAFSLEVALPGGAKRTPTPAPSTGGNSKPPGVTSGYWRFLEPYIRKFVPDPADMNRIVKYDCNVEEGSMSGVLTMDNHQGEGPATWAGECSWTWKNNPRGLDVLVPGDVIEVSMTVTDRSVPERLSGWNHGATGVRASIQFDMPYMELGHTHKAAQGLVNVAAGWRKSAPPQKGTWTVPKGPGDPEWGGKAALVADFVGFGRFERVYVWTEEPYVPGDAKPAPWPVPSTPSVSRMCTGTWTNSVGKKEAAPLVLEESKDGMISGRWSGNVFVSGRQTNATTVELRGQTPTRSYEVMGTIRIDPYVFLGKSEPGFERNIKRTPDKTAHTSGASGAVHGSEI